VAMQAASQAQYRDSDSPPDDVVDGDFKAE
jgi:hypothetical protein